MVEAEPVAAGRVAAIYVSPVAGAAPQSLARVSVLENRGLEGDRYAEGRGSFSRWAGSGRAVTMMEQEAIDAVLEEDGIDLTRGRHRRNIVTAGVRLETLNGRTFRIGFAVLRGARLCAPCRYLERIAA